MSKMDMQIIPETEADSGWSLLQAFLTRSAFPNIRKTDNLPPPRELLKEVRIDTTTTNFPSDEAIDFFNADSSDLPTIRQPLTPDKKEYPQPKKQSALARHLLSGSALSGAFLVME